MNLKTNKTSYWIAWLVVMIGASIPPAVFASQNSGSRSPQPHLTTEWQVSPSFKFDLLCFLNVLTGDSFYHRLREALNTLKSDSFLMDKILNHNRSFGYNSFESFVEEDCVRALEQIITEKMNISREPRQRWRDEDDGMHVFAVALYSLMKRLQYDPSHQPFADFMTRIIASGDLKPGKIQPIYNSFYQH